MLTKVTMHAPSQRPPIVLTPRELDLARALVKGHSNRTIAEKLGLTEQSVKNRLSGLYRKFGVNNRLELVVLLLGPCQALP